MTDHNSDPRPNPPEVEELTPNTDDESDVLPFETRETDVHEGIGVRETIVSLADYTDARPLHGQKRVTDDGRCAWCGYDRGRRTVHTEVEGETVECDHCDATLVEEGEHP